MEKGDHVDNLTVGPFLCLESMKPVDKRRYAVIFVSEGGRLLMRG